MKSIFKSKVFWIATVQAVIAVIIVVEANYPGVKALGAVAIVKSFLDIFLRYITVDQIA